MSREDPGHVALPRDADLDCWISAGALSPFTKTRLLIC